MRNGGYNVWGVYWTCMGTFIGRALDRATRPVAPTSLPELTKRQTKGSTEGLLAQKYGLVDSEGILGQFAKYRLMRIREKGCYSDVHGAVVVSE